MNVYPQSMPTPNAELLTLSNQLDFETADLGWVIEPACVASDSPKFEPPAPMETRGPQVLCAFGRLYRLDVNSDQASRRIPRCSRTPLLLADPRLPHRSIPLARPPCAPRVA